MNIPLTYYFEYWFKNSLLALLTGFLITFLIPPLLAALPLFGLILFLMYQMIIYRHFWGKRRGDFEFSSKENLIKRKINSFIKQQLGIGELIRYKLDHLNSIITYGWDMYHKLARRSENQDEIFHYFLNLIGADLSRKEGDFKKEREYLINAVLASPDDTVSNFRLAVTFEQEGRSDESVNYYRKALEASSIDTPELKEFIMGQITRVIEKGPAKSPPVPGLRFMSW
ncbi:MAG: hypothetical protein P8X96_16350 [Desulfobacteraceae bacterium]